MITSAEGERQHCKHISMLGWLWCWLPANNAVAPIQWITGKRHKQKLCQLYARNSKPPCALNSCARLCLRTMRDNAPKRMCTYERQFAYSAFVMMMMMWTGSGLFFAVYPHTLMQNAMAMKRRRLLTVCFVCGYYILNAHRLRSARHLHMSCCSLSCERFN